GSFANFLQAHSLCRRASCSIFISPMFRCPYWGQVLLKHLRLAVAVPSFISFSSCSVSILASSGNQKHETDAMSALGQKQTLAYSIISSAVCCRCSGTVRPSALAVLRLITSTNLVGACTGRLRGSSPFNMRSIYSADRG